MDAIDCIKTRRSVRQYTKRKISKKILEEIIDCARMAPSACNFQPWEFLVVTKKELLWNLGNAASHGAFIKDAAACIIVCGDRNNHHLVEDGCAAVENILLAANSLGIGTCWVAGLKRTYNESVKELMGIPDKMEIVALIPLGYPLQETTSHNKRTLKEVTHWEKF
jgi:nitroreductase